MHAHSQVNLFIWIANIVNFLMILYRMILNITFPNFFNILMNKLHFWSFRFEFGFYLVLEVSNLDVRKIVLKCSSVSLALTNKKMTSYVKVSLAIFTNLYYFMVYMAFLFFFPLPFSILSPLPSLSSSSSSPPMDVRC